MKAKRLFSIISAILLSILTVNPVMASYNDADLGEVGAVVSNYQIPSGFPTAYGTTYGGSGDQINVRLYNTNASISVNSLTLTANNDGETAAKCNTTHLQAVIDAVSAAGGGIITIKPGTYYFRFNKNEATNNRPHSSGQYIFDILTVKDNVTIAGTRGSDGSLQTWLNPVNAGTNGPVNLFYGTDITNADFRDFGIDGWSTSYTGTYIADGKGFFMYPIQDCDWYNVVVKNTDGSGFGVDEPTNCTITNCTAAACGKRATYADVGASGFGIGYGQKKTESMLIKNCLAVNNKKYGFFYEWQGRFSSIYTESRVRSLVAQNCVAAGNRYNYGGEYCDGAQYIDCKSYSSNSGFGYGNPWNVTSDPNYPSGFRFDSNSGQNYRVDNDAFTTIWNPFSDFSSADWYYTSAYYAVANGIMTGESSTSFSPLTVVDRAHVAESLYSMSREVINAPASAVYPDVSSSHPHADAIKWAKDAGVITGYISGNFGPTDSVTREQMVVILWRFAGYKGYDRSATANLSSFTDAGNVSDWAVTAMQWAVGSGIITGKNNNTQLDPQGQLNKAEASTIYMRFMQTYM